MASRGDEGTSEEITIRIHYLWTSKGAKCGGDPTHPGNNVAAFGKLSAGFGRCDRIEGQVSSLLLIERPWLGLPHLPTGTITGQCDAGTVSRGRLLFP
jgi:hypothetical protein